jgi:DNA repair photolyase
MKTMGTKEWARHNRNCLFGCPGNCLYCYAKKTNIRFRKVTEEDWPKVRPKKHPDPIGKVEGGIMFPTTHDLPWEQREIWLPYLTALLDAGNEVLVVSKPNLKSIMLICETLEKYKSQIEFRFTIGTDDDETRKFWEPGAPSINERIECLKFAHSMGYKTSVSMEPLLTNDPLPLIARISQYVSCTIWIGTMNHMRLSDFKDGQAAWFEEMQFINSKENMERLYNQLSILPKIRWKDSVRDLLGVSQNG